MQSVGIEPTLLRTRALSVRLNRSAKTALCLTKIQERFHGAMATRRIPDPKIGGSIPSEIIHFFLLFNPTKQDNKKFPRRDLNPGLVGENHIS
jgi:hypothetical protein